MASFEQGPAPAEKRRAKRFACNIPGAIVVDRVNHDIRLKDVSALGCCFSGEVEVAKGDEIVCRMRGIEVVATIAWSAPPLHGANFHREINVQQVLREKKERPAFLNRRRAHSMTGFVE